MRSEANVDPWPGRQASADPAPRRRPPPARGTAHLRSAPSLGCLRRLPCLCCRWRPCLTRSHRRLWPFPSQRRPGRCHTHRPRGQGGRQPAPCLPTRRRAGRRAGHRRCLSTFPSQLLSTQGSAWLGANASQRHCPTAAQTARPASCLTQLPHPLPSPPCPPITCTCYFCPPIKPFALFFLPLRSFSPRPCRPAPAAPLLSVHNPILLLDSLAQHFPLSVPLWLCLRPVPLSLA